MVEENPIRDLPFCLWHFHWESIENSLHMEEGTWKFSIVHLKISTWSNKIIEKLYLVEGL